LRRRACVAAAQRHCPRRTAQLQKQTYVDDQPTLRGNSDK
jgi:hypothetical protein